MTSSRWALLALVLATVSTAAAAPPERPQGWYAVVDTTMGSFMFRLLPEQAPQSVADFVAFAQGRMEYVDPFTGNKKKGPYYDGIAIHRAEYGQRFDFNGPPLILHDTRIAKTVSRNWLIRTRYMAPVVAHLRPCSQGANMS